MKLYNSLTDRIEEFQPIEQGKVTMYVCGPTVYNYVHIGNMRPVMTFDMIYKYFKYKGYEVTYASNFTDINPKIISAAETLKITEREVAERFMKAYLEDVANYQCVPIDYRPTVLENLDAIFTFIQKLIDKEYAYVVNGDVYFRVSKVKNYGILSNQNIEELEAGARVEVDEQKEDPLDFALWRSTDHGEQFDSPWGKGIPGWHTECVVMIDSIFHHKIDIHGGGVDLKFPHHENEIAQAMALHDHTLANYWMHNGHINVNGEKMSKSLNNFILAKDFIKEHSANVVRLALFKTHYRLPLNFTEELFDEAKKMDERIENALKQAKSYLEEQQLTVPKITSIETFEQHMDNDFNTPNVISYLLEVIKELNKAIKEKKEEIPELYGKVMIMLDILGLQYNLEQQQDEDLVKMVEEQIKLRKEAKMKKDFETADKIRMQLEEKGIILKDTREGTVWEVK